MSNQLPGTSSGKTVALSAAKASLRLLVGGDLADAVADMTGLSARRVKSLAQEAAQRMRESGQVEHEHSQGPNDSYSVMESEVVSAFQRAVQRDPQAIPIAALTGVDDLVNTVSDEVMRHEMSGWSQAETGYTVALMREVAALCREWYLENGPARDFATAAGVGKMLKGHDQILLGQQEALSILRQQFGMSRSPQMDAAVEALTRRLAEIGWDWTPARSGAARGLDGFMTPTDENGAFLPFEIPVRLLRGPTRKADRGGLVGPPVSRDEVALLCAHSPSGYLIVYSESDESLYFAAAAKTAKRFDRSNKSRERVRMMSTAIVTDESLGAIGRSARVERNRLTEALVAPRLREPALRLYQNLSSAHHIFFEFLAALAFVDPGNLMFVYEKWADDTAAGNTGEDDHLQVLVSTMNEYEVRPPVELLQNFPAASLMLTVLRSVIDDLDTISSSLETDYPGIVGDLGISGLRTTIAGAIARSYRAPDGAPISVKNSLEEKPSWIVLDYAHYFMDVALVALVVDRLVLSIRGLVLPPVKGSQRLTPRPGWIRYRQYSGA